MPFTHQRPLLVALLALLIALAACAGATDAPLTLPVTRRPPTPTPHVLTPRPQTPTPRDTEIPEGDPATVTYVIDGDTIEVELDGRTYRLRYIGVDTPEREEPYYQEARDFNRDLVADQTVILVRDVSETDQYGRLLRYVYLEDGTFVNAAIIASGLGRLVTFPPDVAQTEYLKGLQAEAREAGQGMWGDTATGPCDCDRNLYDCRDFDTQTEAQTCFEYCLDTAGRDVHNLDGGGDGLVCESLP
ncbi:MAG: thermonuclease family protein [Candidatus Promineofilum sp.]|nr:thermonuclease family protein [Promineifilum sp.]MCW5864135.1 thermonuclease family protein [Anaerolineae bacterium]